MKKIRLKETLSDEAKRIGRRLAADFELDDTAGELLLNEALEAYDTVRGAQAIIEKEGIVIPDRFGQKRQHPATLVLRDARNLMLRCLKQLNLDIAPNNPLGGR